MADYANDACSHKSTPINVQMSHYRGNLAQQYASGGACAQTCDFSDQRSSELSFRSARRQNIIQRELAVSPSFRCEDDIGRLNEEGEVSIPNVFDIKFPLPPLPLPHLRHRRRRFWRRRRARHRKRAPAPPPTTKGRYP